MSTGLFTVKIAEMIIGIKPLSDTMRTFCRRYLCEGDPAFTICVSEEDIEEERERMINYMGRGDASDEELEQLFIYRQIAETIPKYGAFLMHATAICVDGEAYLLAGPSGAGKTTHAKLWKKVFDDRMRVINDDKPILRLIDNQIMIYGSPWSGKERWQNNISAPLKAILFINQSKENYIEPMDHSEAWNSIMNQIYRSTNAKNMKKTLDFINQLVNDIPIYSMYCNRSEEAVHIAYEAVSK